MTNSEPEVIRNALPQGDPENSSGKYDKIKEILDLDISRFCDLKSGLIRICMYMIYFFSKSF